MPYSKRELQALLSKVQNVGGGKPNGNSNNGNWRNRRNNGGNSQGNQAAEINGLRKTVDLLYNKVMMLESLVILSCIAEPSPLRLIHSDNKKRDVLRERLADKTKRHKILAALYRKDKIEILKKNMISKEFSILSFL